MTKGQLVLSFRSTEFIDDAVRDNQATNTLEIKERGWAFGQIADMESWYASLLRDGDIPAGAKFAVTGYSLGGHLATAFNLLRQNDGTAGRIESTYTFNGAGVGTLRPGEKLSEVIDSFRGIWQGGAATQLSSIKGLELYAQIKSEVAAQLNPVTVEAALDKVSTARVTLPSSTSDYAAVIADYDLLTQALKRIESVVDEHDRVSRITNSGGAAPLQVGLENVAAAGLDYQIGVLIASRDTHAYPSVSLSALGDPEAGIYSMLADRRNVSPSPIAKFWDVYASKYPSAVANSQLHYGTALGVAVEDQPLRRGSYFLESLGASIANWDIKLLVDNFSLNDFGDTHSLVLLVDSLSVQSVLAQLAPDLEQKTWSGLIAAATNLRGRSTLIGQGQAEGDALENIVNALAAHFGVASALKGNPNGNSWFDVASRDGYTGREDLHAVLHEIKADTAFQAMAGHVTIAPVGELLAAHAKARTDFADILALQALSPFVLRTVPGHEAQVADAWQASAWSSQYAQWLVDGNLSSAEINAGSAAFADAWINDRAAMLAALTRYNLASRTDDTIDPGGAMPLATTVYFDAASGRTLTETPVITLPPRFIKFGDGGNDTLLGESLDDRLYGGEGNDELKGQSGDDRLEGHAGADSLDAGFGKDTLLGGSGDDTLDGGRDNDILLGGFGRDTYLFTEAWGRDTLTDSDGLGRIKIGGLDLLGGRGVGGRGGWQEQLLNGQVVRYRLIDSAQSSTGKQLLISVEGDEVNAITVNNFDADAAMAGTYLGIYLNNTPGVAIVQGPAASFWSDLGANISSLAGKGTTIAEGAASAFRVFLNTAAKAGEQFVLNLTGLAGKGVKALFGGRVVDADGAAIVLAEGQTQVSFALLQDGELGSDATGSMAVSYRGEDGRAATSNTWGLTLKDSGEPSATMTGDLIARTLSNNSGPILRSGPNGAVTVVPAGGVYFAADANGNLSDGGTTYTVLHNVLIGTAGSDAIHGGVGNDLLAGNAGNDQIQGGADDDMIAGGAGSDLIEGGAGNDFISSAANLQPGSQQLGPNDLWSQWGLPAGRTAVAQGSTWGVYTNTSGVLIWSGVTAPATDEQSDAIDAGAGDDHVLASWGDDRAQGGEGNDQIEGLAGGDIIEGDAGNDTLDGDGTILAGLYDTVDAARHGADFIDGGEGADSITGQGNADDLFGGDGSDTIFGDTARSSTQLDFLPILYHSGDYIDGESGDDQAEGNGGADTLYGGGGNDLLWGDQPASRLSGAALADVAAWGDDLVDGEDGNDTLIGGGGADVLYGGDGADRITGDESSLALLGTLHGADEIDGEAGNDTLIAGGDSDTVYGGTGNDQLYGDDAQSVLAGAFQAGDYLDGEDGDDLIWGQGGSDTLYGGTGNDQLQGDDDPSRLAAEFHGADELDGEDGDDTLLGGGGADTLWGGSGNDALVGDALEGPGAMLFTQYQLADALDGGEGDDTLLGGGGADELTGGDGADYLCGGSGDDWLNGGDGEDVYRYELGDGIDHISDTGGTDMLSFGPGVTFNDLHLGLGSLKITFGNAAGEIHLDDFDIEDAENSGSIEYFEFADGSLFTYSQLLAKGFELEADPDTGIADGTSLNERIGGGGGNDQLYGAGGNDMIYAGPGEDSLYGGDGHDLLQAAGGNDLLMGGPGNDTLEGYDGDDVYIFGRGDGSDTLIDSSGQDTLVLDALSSEQVTFLRQGNDLVVSLADSPSSASDKITLQGWYFGGVGTFQFDDGTVLDRAAIQAMTRVNSAPLPVPDAGAVREDTTITVSGNALSNDRDVDAMAALRITNPGTYTGQYGTLVLASNGEFTYTLNNAAAKVQGLSLTQSVTERFAYTVTDDDPSQPKTASSFINIAVQGINDAPVALPDFAQVSEDAVTSTTGLPLANDSDADKGVYSNLGFTNGDIGVFTGKYGSMAFAFDMGFRFTYTLSNDSIAVQALAEGVVVQEVFTYHAFDALAATPSTVTVSITGANDAPTLANPIADQTVAAGTNASLLIPTNTFSDIDQGDTLYWSATMADGSALPTWMKFDAATHTFTGQVPATATGALDVMVSVSDRASSTATAGKSSDNFKLTITGTPVIPNPTGPNDNIKGTPKADVLLGGWGNDTIKGEPGDDRLYGDDGVSNDARGGDDSLDGGPGEDTLFGQGGDDTLKGGPGEDWLHGGRGNDLLDGGPGKDHYFFALGDGQDTIVHTPDGGDLTFAAGITRASLTATRANDDLVLSIRNTTDTITFQDWFHGKDGGKDGAKDSLTQIAFADGSIMDRKAIAAMVQLPVKSAEVMLVGIAHDTAATFAEA